MELSAAARAHADADLTLTEDTTMLSPERLSAFDVVVYKTGGKLAEAEEEALAEFVRGGKGLFGLHGAAASFKENLLYHQVLGSAFVEHPPFAEIGVQVRYPTHPILRGVDDFAVEDEPYLLDKGPEELDVLTTARLALGGDARLSAYFRRWGEGRVLYLGHDFHCLRAEPFRRMAGQGLMWAAGR